MIRTLFILTAPLLFHNAMLVNIQCDFDYIEFTSPGTIYACKVVNNLNIDSSSAFIENVYGTHKFATFFYNGNKDVKGITIVDKVTSYMPTNLDKIFENLIAIKINYGRLKEIRQSDIKAFPKLQTLNLDYNDIETLDDDLFKFNLALVSIWLDHNKIKAIGYSTFDHLAYLKDLDFEGNICAKGRSEDITSVDRLRSNFKQTCFTPGKGVIELKIKSSQLQENNSKLTVEINQLKIEISLKSTEVEKLKSLIKNSTYEFSQKEQEMQHSIEDISSRLKGSERNLTLVIAQLKESLIQKQVTIEQLKKLEHNFNNTKSEEFSEKQNLHETIDHLKNELINREVNMTILEERLSNSEMMKNRTSKSLKELQSQLADLKNIESELRHNKSELEERLETKEIDYENMTEILENYSMKLLNYEEQITELEMKFNETVSELSAANANSIELTKKLTIATFDNEKLQNNLRNTTKLLKKSNTNCETELEKLKIENDKKSSQIKHLNNTSYLFLKKQHEFQQKINDNELQFEEKERMLDSVKAELNESLTQKRDAIEKLIKLEENFNDTINVALQSEEKFKMTIYHLESQLNGKHVNLTILEEKFRNSEILTNKIMESFMELQSELEDLKKIESDLRFNKSELEDRLETKEIGYENMTAILSNYSMKLLDYEQQIIELNLKYNESATEISTLNAEIIVLSIKLRNATFYNEKLQNDLENMTEILSKSNSNFAMKLDKFNFEIEQKLIEIKYLNNSLDQFLKNKQEMQKKINDFELQLKEKEASLEIVKVELKKSLEINMKYNETISDYAELIKKLPEVTSDKEKLQNDVDNMTNLLAESKSKFIAEVGTLKIEIQQRSTEIDNLKNSTNHCSGLNKEFQQKIKDTGNQLNEKERELELVKTELSTSLLQKQITLDKFKKLEEIYEIETNDASLEKKKLESKIVQLQDNLNNLAIKLKTSEFSCNNIQLNQLTNEQSNATHAINFSEFIMSHMSNETIFVITGLGLFTLLTVANIFITLKFYRKKTVVLKPLELETFSNERQDDNTVE